MNPTITPTSHPTSHTGNAPGSQGANLIGKAAARSCHPGVGGLTGLCRCLALATAVACAATCGATVRAEQGQPAGRPTWTAAAEQAQNGYLDSLRDLLQHVARYPTGREASHQRALGDVTVRFALTRDGGVREVRLVRSSESMVLDGAALSAVRRAAYPAFAHDLYPGQTSHDFLVTLSYTRPGERRGAAPYHALAAVEALVVAVQP